MAAPKKADEDKLHAREVTYVTDDEAKALAELARRERVSKSTIIRRAVLAYLDRQKIAS
ncbi:MAG: CopG family transcriptional regulator [Thermoanaerobaculia bacterium]|nr:CopG family transcriptional regulator [Thermoanaerobaculia bacterium]